MGNKIKHLEFIQSTIGRMANNSFLLKGWSVTIMVGLFALSLKQWSAIYIFVSVAMLLSFWLLDCYYLSRERLFVALFNHVRKKNDQDIDFAMETREFESGYDWCESIFSKTTRIFYGGLLIINLIMIGIL